VGPGPQLGLRYVRSNSITALGIHETDPLLPTPPIDEEFGTLGYKQELHRGFSALKNILFSFTAVAVVSSISNLFPTALATGGPAVVIWSWIGGSIMTLVVAYLILMIGIYF
jgi:hypothetical protein